MPTDTAEKALLTLPDGTRIGKVKTAAGTVARDEATLITKLKQGQWPAKAKAPLAILEKAVQKQHAVFVACSHAASVADVKKILDQNKPTLAAVAPAAQRVRTALGLPAVGS